MPTVLFHAAQTRHSAAQPKVVEARISFRGFHHFRFYVEWIFVRSIRQTLTSLSDNPMKVQALARQGDTLAASRENTMKKLSRRLQALIRDDQGGEVIEYALVAGLISVAAIAVVGAVGTKVAAKWTSVNSSL
jgi:Flp pilus assembly pilin Flp